jgi:hypothetical protein
MKAFVVRPNGLSLFVTREYKTLKNLLRYGVKPYIKIPKPNTLKILSTCLVSRIRKETKWTRTESEFNSSCTLTRC